MEKINYIVDLSHLYKISHVKEIVEDYVYLIWASSSLPKTDDELYEEALEKLPKTISYNVPYSHSPKNVKNLQSKLVSFIDKDDCRYFTFEVEYDSYRYIGPKDGKQFVLQRHYPTETQGLSTKEYYEKISDDSKEGLDFLETAIPGAIHRVGCNCCYGDGPDLESEHVYMGNDDLLVNYYIDFDFRRD